MASLTAALRFIGKSRRERASILHGRWRMALSYFFFVVLGRWVNRPGSALILVARPDFDYDQATFPEYRILHPSWKKAVEIINGSDLVRLFLLSQNVRQICREHIEGDFVELGVYKGNSAIVLKHYATSNTRKLFLFDTFSGFDEADFRVIDADVRHTGFRDTSLDYVKRVVGTEDVIYVPGFFPQSTNEAPELPRLIAVFHIDCDLYAPTKAGLEFFYPRMSRGGLIIMHDYGSMCWPGTTQAVDEFFADKPESVIVMPDKSGTAVVRKI